MSTAAARLSTALRRAAVRATLAPSVHNTQPWRLRLVGGRLEIYADRSRQLHVLDPTSRQLLISCGCAIMNARTSLAGEGVAAEIWRTANPMSGELLAAIAPVEGSADPALTALDAVLELRQTNRRQFADEQVPDAVLETLESAATAEGASLFVVRDADQRASVAKLSQWSDDIENLNPAYRAELRAWTSDDADRRDGVHSITVPHVDGAVRDEVPIRDFDTHGTGWLPSDTRSTRDQTLALLCTEGDSAGEWLRAGEALERVLLEITRHGYSASPLTQVTEVPAARVQLRDQLRLVSYPHVLVRIGRAPVAPTSRRRRLVDVLVDES